MFYVLDQCSIIIPVAAQETAHHHLLKQLDNSGAELIVVSNKTRAKSLNEGALQAKRRFLWFVHADSIINKRALQKLDHALQKYPQSLHYFDLAFTGPSYMRFNAMGANLRSRLLGIPFGDQCFAMDRTVFDNIGPYCESCTIGEDLHLIWQAKKASTPIKRIDAIITTDSRKYHQVGWYQLTLKYQKIWIAVSFAHLCQLLWQRLRSRLNVTLDHH